MALSKQDKKEIVEIIVETVNGKIDKLAEKFEIHEEKMEPIFEVYKTTNNVARFMRWLSYVIISLGVIVAAFKGFLK